MEVLLSIQSKADGSVREVKREIADGLAVGRGAEEGVLLDGPDLSREHLMLTTDGSVVYVTDLSNNGTWLNGTRLRRSIKSRVRAEDSIELPGYILTFRLPEQPQESVEVSPREAPAAVSADSHPAQESPRASGPLAMLDPVFHFIGSFTFMEKFLAVVSCSGLLLLYTYFKS
ncbi:MAG: FHA domain-containing protein [Terriglobales bacterium]